MSPPFSSLLRKLGLISLFGAAAAAITLWLWGCFCMFSAGGWNAIRLAPSFMWQAGVNPYPGPFGGPVTTWIYGPLPIILQWPATLLHDAAAAVMAAGMINLFVAVVPLGAAVCAQAAPGTPNATRVWALLLALARGLVAARAGILAVALVWASQAPSINPGSSSRNSPPSDFS